MENARDHTVYSVAQRSYEDAYLKHFTPPAKDSVGYFEIFSIYSDERARLSSSSQFTEGGTDAELEPSSR